MFEHEFNVTISSILQSGDVMERFFVFKEKLLIEILEKHLRINAIPEVGKRITCVKSLNKLKETYHIDKGTTHSEIIMVFELKTKSIVNLNNDAKILVYAPIQLLTKLN